MFLAGPSGAAPGHTHPDKARIHQAITSSVRGARGEGKEDHTSEERRAATTVLPVLHAWKETGPIDVAGFIKHMEENAIASEKHVWIFLRQRHVDHCVDWILHNISIWPS